MRNHLDKDTTGDFKVTVKPRLPDAATITLDRSLGETLVLYRRDRLNLVGGEY